MSLHPRQQSIPVYLNIHHFVFIVGEFKNSSDIKWEIVRRNQGTGIPGVAGLQRNSTPKSSRSFSESCLKLAIVSKASVA